MHGAKDVCFPTWLKLKYQKREMSMQNRWVHEQWHQVMYHNH